MNVAKVTRRPGGNTTKRNDAGRSADNKRAKTDETSPEKGIANLLRDIGLDPYLILFRALWAEDNAARLARGEVLDVGGLAAIPGEPVLLREGRGC